MCKTCRPVWIFLNQSAIRVHELTLQAIRLIYSLNERLTIQIEAMLTKHEDRWAKIDERKRRVLKLKDLGRGWMKQKCFLGLGLNVYVIWWSTNLIKGQGDECHGNEERDEPQNNFPGHCWESSLKANGISRSLESESFQASYWLLSSPSSSCRRRWSREEEERKTSFDDPE